MKFNTIITIIFGISVIIPCIGFSESYNQMLEQAENQNQNDTTKDNLSKNQMMQQYAEDGQSHKQSGQAQAEKIFEQDNKQSY